MSINVLRAVGLAAAIFALPTFAMAATVSAGDNSFDNGFATGISYEDDAARGTTLDRDNALNALGSDTSDFFEIGFGSSVDLTFGTLFSTDSVIFETTNGAVSDFPESIDIFAGLDGLFVQVGSITNADAQGGATVVFTVDGVFDTLRLVDTSSPVNGATTGGFDIAAVQVSAVPVPAAGLLLLSAIGGMTAMRRRKSKS